MICTFELNDADTKFAEDYAKETGESVGEMAKRFMLEDISDLRAAESAMAEYEKDPVTYTHEEIGRMLSVAK